MGYLPLSLGKPLHSLVDFVPGETFLLCFIRSVEGVDQWLIIVCIVVAPRGTGWNCRPVVLGKYVCEARNKQVLPSHLRVRRVKSSKEVPRVKMIYQDPALTYKNNQEKKEIVMNLGPVPQCNPAGTPRYNIQNLNLTIQTNLSNPWKPTHENQSPSAMRVAVHCSSVPAEATCKEVHLFCTIPTLVMGKTKRTLNAVTETHWRRLQEVVDVIPLNFISIVSSTLSTDLLLETSGLLPHLLSVEVYYWRQAFKLNHHSRVKANICCQPDIEKGKGIMVNTFIQPSSPFSLGITHQLCKVNPRSQWFH